MLTEELVSGVVTSDPEDTDGSQHDDLDVKPVANGVALPRGVVVEGLQASWTNDPQKLVLDDISFTITKVTHNYGNCM